MEIDIGRSQLIKWARDGSAHGIICIYTLTELIRVHSRDQLDIRFCRCLVLGDLAIFGFGGIGVAVWHG